MKKISTDTKTFYYIEVSQEVYDRITYGCNMIDQMYSGNLEVVKNMAFEAYRKRTGEEIPEDMKLNIIDCIKGLEAWGWGKPLEDPSCINQEAKIFRDIFQTLDYQQCLLGLSHETEDIPEHHCPTIPRPRIINVLPVKQKRNKPLKTYCTDFSKRRRI